MSFNNEPECGGMGCCCARCIIDGNDNDTDRITGLARECNDLRKKLKSCTEEKENLQDELFNAYYEKDILLSLIATLKKENAELKS